jgi:hypothetical protein
MKITPNDCKRFYEADSYPLGLYFIFVKAYQYQKNLQA